MIPSLRAAELDPQPVDVARTAAARCATDARSPRRCRARASAARSSRGSRGRRRATRRGARAARRRYRRARRPRASRSRPPAPAVTRDDASGDAARTAQRPQERVLPVPLEPGEPDELARVQLEVDPRAPGRSRTPGPAGRRRRSEGARAGRGRSSVRCSAPVISRTSSAASTSPRARVATVSPDRITVTRSPISSISSIRCEMKIVLVPSRREPADDRRTAGRASRRRAPRSPRRGSRIRGRANERARDAARLPVAERELLDRRVEVGRGAGELEQRLGRALEPLRPSRLRRRSSGSMPSQTLSRIERGGTTSTSWKTATIPSSSASRGERIAESASARRPRSTRDRAGGRPSAS